MGAAKRLLEAHQHKLMVAEDIAVEAGALERCEFHDFVYDTWGDPVEAYKLGNRKFTAGEVAVFADRREMTDYIQDAITQSADECGYCAKWASD